MSIAHTAQGRGKLIIFGEHSVVYGYPAVACGLPSGARAKIRADGGACWRITHSGGQLHIDETIRQAGARLLDHFGLSLDELSIEMELSIPVGAGLGSSAALSVALARAAASLIDLPAAKQKATINAAVAASEAVFHGQASGIDQQASMSQGFFLFRRQNSSTHIAPFAAPPRQWLVAKVAPTASTAEQVAALAKRRAHNRARFDTFFEQLGTIAQTGARALREGRYDEVGQLINQNHHVLQKIGVSSPKLDAACQAAQQAGALGAKLTGAGGGGCILAIPGEDPAPLIDALLEHGQVFKFTLPTDDPSSFSGRS